MEKNSPKNLTFSIVVEKDLNGYVAECHELQGCYTEAKSYEEAVQNMREVIELHLEDRLLRGDLAVKDFDQNSVSLTTLSFALPFRNAA